MKKNMEHWFNDADRGKHKYLEKNTSKYQRVRHKFHMEIPVFEPEPPQ